MHMLRTHLRGQLLWKCKVCILSRIYAFSTAHLKVLEETEDNEQNHRKPFLKGSMVKFHLVGDLGCSSNVHNVP